MNFFISSVLLLVLGNFKSSSEMAIIKGPGSLAETRQDCSSGETTQIPEATNVRSKIPETDLLNDVDLPQSSPDRTESLSPSSTSIAPKTRRCARPGTIGSSQDVTLSLARRDVNEIRRQQCEICKNRPICKRFNRCTTCKTFCENLETDDHVVTTTIPTDNEDGAQMVPENNVLGEILNERDTDIEDTPANTDIILGSRIGESSEEENESRPRYYTLGSIKPGPLMHLFAKAFNIPSEENFEKFIILGKLRDSQVDNQDRLVIIDLAQAFGTDKKNVATVHEPIKNIDPEKIAELDRRLDDGIARKKQELNTDHLDNNQIHEVINEALEEMSQNNRLENSVQEVPPSTDPTVELSETATKCSNVDEAVDDLLHIMPISNSGRSKGEYGKYEQQHEDEEDDNEEEIKNPPVIQDNLNLVGKNIQNGWIDDNGEARPGVTDESVLSPQTIIEAPENNNIPNDANLVENRIGDAPKEDEILTVSGQVQPVPESDNQINAPAEDIQERINAEINQETEGVKDNEDLIVNTVAAPAPEERGDDVAISEKPSPVLLNETPEEKRDNNLIGNPPSSSREELEKNIIELVEDSLKTVSNSGNLLESTNRNLENLEKINTQPLSETASQNQELLSSNDPFTKEERIQPSLTKDNEEATLNQAIADNALRVAETAKEPQDHQEILEKQNEFEPTSTAHIKEPVSIDLLGNDPVTVENSDSGPNMVEMAPNSENRGQFSDESDSEEKLSKFGSLIPAEAVQNSQVKKLYFVGEDIKLPLKMFKDGEGIMHLKVDVDKLCHCKNKNCTRKHHDSQESIEKITPNNFRENEDGENAVLPEINVRYGRDTQRNAEMINSLESSLHSINKSSKILKRSPNINYRSVNHMTVDEERKENHKLQEIETTEKKLENEIEKLTKNIENYVGNSNIINKGNVALFKDIEKTKDVGRMITLANNVLSWMKDLATKNLNS